MLLGACWDVESPSLFSLSVFKVLRERMESRSGRKALGREVSLLSSMGLAARCWRKVARRPKYALINSKIQKRRTINYYKWTKWNDESLSLAVDGRSCFDRAPPLNHQGEETHHLPPGEGASYRGSDQRCATTACNRSLNTSCYSQIPFAEKEKS